MTQLYLLKRYEEFLEVYKFKFDLNMNFLKGSLNELPVARDKKEKKRKEKLRKQQKAPHIN